MSDLRAIVEIVLNQRQTLMTLVLASLVLVPATTFLARRVGWSWWRIGAAGCTSLGTALAIATTLGRYGDGVGLWWPHHCLLQPGLSWTTAEEQLNVLLFAPASFFAVLALRGYLQAVGLALLGSVLVETVQSATGMGVCRASDVVSNMAGAAFAGLMAVGWLRIADRALGHRGRAG